MSPGNLTSAIMLAGSLALLVSCETEIPPRFADLGLGTAHDIDQGTVVGAQWQDGFFPFKWTLAGGLVNLPGPEYGRALAINGNNIVGQAEFYDTIGFQAALWENGSSALNLGIIADTATSAAYGVDRQTIGGWHSTSIPSYVIPVNWRGPSHSLGLLQAYPWQAQAVAMDVQNDTLVGISWPRNQVGIGILPLIEPKKPMEPVMWPGPSPFNVINLVSLGITPAGAISTDDGTIVGFSTSATDSNRIEAVRWFSSVQIESLGTLGGDYAIAMDIEDGIIVGGSTLSNAASMYDLHAFKWTETDGMTDIHPANWVWSVATGVDQMGNICGYGEAPDGSLHGFVWY